MKVKTVTIVTSWKSLSPSIMKSPGRIIWMQAWDEVSGRFAKIS